MKLTQKQCHQLADVLEHFYIDEEKDYRGYPQDDHIFLSIKALSDALIAYQDGIGG